MTRNERISLDLTDLPIKSISEIFSFLEVFLKDDCLDFDVFKNKIGKFNTLEQYFICEYGERCFSEEKLRSWLKDFAKQYDDDIIGLIRENSGNFILNIQGLKKSLKRKATNYKRKNITFKYLPTASEEKPEPFRLPLNFAPKQLKDYDEKYKNSTSNKTSFKKEVLAIFKNMLSTEDCELFFYNSFDFKTNHYPISLQYIEITDITAFKNKIYELYTSYINFYQFEKKRYQDYYNSSIKQIQKGLVEKKFVDKKGFVINTNETSELSEIRKKFYKQPKESFTSIEITKAHFTKILYNNFPHIREEYFQKKVKNPGYQLETFLKSIENRIRKTTTKPNV